MIQEEFIKASIRERQELVKWFKHYFKNKSYSYELTPVDGYDPYDAKLFFNGRTYLIECKIRDTHYNPLYLEKKKYDSLIKYKNEYDYILYFNKTPNGIYIGNISKLIMNNITIEDKYCQISTIDKTKGNTLKSFIPMYIGVDMKKY